MLKLEQNGISGNLCKTLHDFLDSQKRSVMLNSQNSIWVSVRAGVSECSVLALLFFLIYINDLSNCLPSALNYFLRTHFCFLFFMTAIAQGLNLMMLLAVVKLEHS